MYYYMEMKLEKLTYNNEKLNIQINAFINKKEEIWFQGKEIALLLDYKDTDQAIRKNVDKEDKKLINCFSSPRSTPVWQTGQDKNPQKIRKCYFINESGFYSLVMNSKLPTAKKFKRWVTSEVLPSLRKHGYFDYERRNIIETESDLHYEVVSFIRNRYPEALMIAGLGENQKTQSSRIDSWKKGYMAGQCDLMIMNPTVWYSALCIEFKDPRGLNYLSQKQIRMREMYKKNRCKYLVSRSISDIIFEIIKYMKKSRKYLKN